MYAPKSLQFLIHIPFKNDPRDQIVHDSSRLRARQKDRLARRSNNIPESSCLHESMNEGDETLMQNKRTASSLDQFIPSSDSTDVVDVGSSKVGRMQKPRNEGVPGNNDQLPVLGLCAPNAHVSESISQKVPNFLSPKVPSFEERRIHSESPMLPNNTSFSDAFDRCMRSIATGAGFSFNLVCFSIYPLLVPFFMFSSIPSHFILKILFLSSLHSFVMFFLLANMLNNGSFICIG